MKSHNQAREVLHEGVIPTDENEFSVYMAFKCSRMGPRVEKERSYFGPKP